MAPKKDKQFEEKQQKRIRARFNFKSLIRKVVINNYWLSELEDQTLGDNVKRNIAIITRRRSNRGSLLSILDKAALNVPADERTNEQKWKLAQILLEVSCLARFSPVSESFFINISFFLEEGGEVWGIETQTTCFYSSPESSL